MSLRLYSSRKGTWQDATGVCGNDTVSMNRTWIMTGNIAPYIWLAARYWRYHTRAQRKETTNHLSLNTVTKWPPFFRQDFQIHGLVWILYIVSNFTGFFLRLQITIRQLWHSGLIYISVTQWVNCWNLFLTHKTVARNCVWNVVTVTFRIWINSKSINGKSNVTS